MSRIAPHRVVIVGAGFAGLYAAGRLKHAPVDISIIDPSNHHLFQPLLYQVATGALSPGDIASPVRGVLRRQRNVRVFRDAAIDIDPEGRLITRSGSFEYDTLVIAAGLQNHYLGQDDWRPHAPGLKSLTDALNIRSRLLSAFEEAETERDEKRRDQLLTIAVVGGGPTGVETAGAIAELARDTLRYDFRAVDPRNSRIVLVEAGERLLPSFHPSLSARAARDLGRMGVDVMTGTLVTGIEEGRIRLSAESGESVVNAGTIIWSAGIRAAGFAETVARVFATERDRSGRVVVNPDLTIPGHPDVFIAGDLASLPHRDRSVPMVAPAAIQEGKHVAKMIRRRLRGGETKAFSYFDKGSLAVIGRNRAVVQVAGLRFAGFPAWLIWILVHILFLIGFDNRMLVMFQWAWTYFTRNRGARLILE